MDETKSTGAGQQTDANKSMEGLSCPSSLTSLMSNSQYGQVVFHDIYDVYPTDGDLYFHYTLTETVKPKIRDRICLYKVGWKQITDFYIDTPAVISMIEKDRQLCNSLRSSFSACKLPKDEEELYQLCYLTVDGKIAGASTPFAFRRPHETDICSVESHGMVVYKSRIAVLHDKIASLEENKEETELKVITMHGKLSILEKELSSTTTSNRDLLEELKNAKEDVKLLTESLKRSNDELKELQSAFKQQNVDHEKIKTALGELHSNLKDKEEELQNVKKELNNVKQDHVQAELTLREVTLYNSRLKNDLDTLKQENGSLIVNGQRLVGDNLRSFEEEQQGSNLLEHPPRARVVSSSDAKLDQLEGLRRELKRTRELLDATLQSQAATGEEKQEIGRLIDMTQEQGKELSYVKQISEDKSKECENLKVIVDEQSNIIAKRDTKIVSFERELLKLSVENSKLKNELDKQTKLVRDQQSKEMKENILKNTITEQYQQILKLNDELTHLKSDRKDTLSKEGESKLLEEIKKLTHARDSAIELNVSVLLRLNSLEDEFEKCKSEYEIENDSLKTKINELEKQPKTSDKIEELETLVNCLKTALLKQPSLEEFCHIILESTRVTAMDTYKELFDSVQYLDFENADYKLKVRRLVDEFGVLKQDLDRCRLENQTIHKERDQLKDDFTKIVNENEFHKNKILELKETVSEVSNCLEAVRKESNDAIKKGSNEPQLVKDLKMQLETVKAKSDDLEKQLKEAKIANALTNIGKVTVDESSLVTEVEQLRCRVSELEAQIQSNPNYQSYVDKMQEKLKRSTNEYAKLYQQLQTERKHYQKLLTSINSFQRPSTVPSTEPGLSSANSS